MCLACVVCWRTVVEVRDHTDVQIVVWQVVLDSPRLLLLNLLPVPLELSPATRRPRILILWVRGSETRSLLLAPNIP